VGNTTEHRWKIQDTRVVIKVDMVDSSMLSEAQIDTEIQALLETIDAWRRR